MQLRRTHFMTVLSLLGLLATAYVLVDMRADLAFARLGRALPWLLVLVPLDVGSVWFEVQAVRALHRPYLRAVSSMSLLRANLMAHAAAAVMPGGRVAAELMRGGELTSFVGAARATLGGVVMQASFVTAAALAAIGTSVVLQGSDASLSAVLALTGAMSAAISAALFVASQSPRVAALVLPRLGFPMQAEWTQRTRFVAGDIVQAVLWQVGARGLHWFQIALLIAVMHGGITATQAAAGEAVQLVAASVGDGVPAQLGVLEATFRLYADVLANGAAGALGVAASFVLLLRLTRVVAALCSGLAAWALGVATPGAVLA